MSEKDSLLLVLRRVRARPQGSHQRPIGAYLRCVRARLVSWTCLEDKGHWAASCLAVLRFPAPSRRRSSDAELSQAGHVLVTPIGKWFRATWPARTGPARPALDGCLHAWLSQRGF
uniref:Uncharacterized protein n=1 Tax=Pseudomonas phage PACT201 TaxID=3230130 RepID=A0AAU8GW32_9VIRU